MENQHPIAIEYRSGDLVKRVEFATPQGATPDSKITGYRDLSRVETDLINRIKAHAELTRQLVDDVKSSLNKFSLGVERGPFKWANIADDHLQQGFMALTRAVAQPTTY
jgi:hypothetical protein